MNDSQNGIKIRSGLNWFFLMMGLGSLIFAVLASIGGSEFGEVWGVWLFAILGIWLFRTDEFWLTDDNYTDRDMFWRENIYSLDDLKWIEFRFKKKVFLWIGDEKKEIKLSGPLGKRVHTAIEKLGAERLPYFGYIMAERSRLSRGQLSGCLDCHQIFPSIELKYWEKLPKSFWFGRKSDQYFSQCPDCKGGWVYTSQNSNRPVTSEALQKMDASFPMNKETKLREIIGETMAFQTSFQYLK